MNQLSQILYTEDDVSKLSEKMVKVHVSEVTKEVVPKPPPRALLSPPSERAIPGPSRASKPPVQERRKGDSLYHRTKSMDYSMCCSACRCFSDFAKGTSDFLCSDNKN